METLYDAIATRYNFVIPNVYRVMESRGWFNFVKDKPGYLWLHEAEWLSLNQIAQYEFADYYKSGFVPFAFNGAGDLWCWWPKATQDAVTPVVLCPHDECEGQFRAPDFLGFLYRQILSYAVFGCIDIEEEGEAREQLRSWYDSFMEFFPHSWSATIMSITNKPLISYEVGAGFIWQDEYEEIVTRDLAFPGLNQKFRWMI